VPCEAIRQADLKMGVREDKHASDFFCGRSSSVASLAVRILFTGGGPRKKAGREVRRTDFLRKHTQRPRATQTRGTMRGLTRTELALKQPTEGKNRSTKILPSPSWKGFHHLRAAAVRRVTHPVLCVDKVTEFFPMSVQSACEQRSAIRLKKSQKHFAGTVSSG